MIKRSQTFINHAEELLRQFAQTGDEDLSAILSTDDLDEFQKKLPCEKENIPPAKPCHFL